MAAGLGIVMSHPVDYPEAYASVTVLSPTMVAWLADTFGLNGQAHTTPMTYHNLCPTKHPSWRAHPRWVAAAVPAMLQMDDWRLNGAPS